MLKLFLKLKNFIIIPIKNSPELSNKNEICLLENPFAYKPPKTVRRIIRSINRPSIKRAPLFSKRSSSDASKVSRTGWNAALHRHEGDGDQRAGFLSENNVSAGIDPRARKPTLRSAASPSRAFRRYFLASPGTNATRRTTTLVTGDIDTAEGGSSRG